MSNMKKSIFVCAFYALVSITCLTSLCSDPNPQKSAFNAVKHAMNGNGLYTPFSNEYMDKLNSKEHEDKLFPSKKKGLIMTLLGVAGTGIAIYHGVNAWKETVDSGLGLASGINQTVQNDMKTQYEKQVKDKLDEFNKWKEDEKKRIEEENKKIKYEHEFLDEKRQGCLQHHAQIIDEFGHLLGAKSAVDTLSYSQLQMLSASELMSGGNNRYFTDLFNKETKRLSEQIKKGQTDEVKAVMSFLSQKNNNSKSPTGSREGSRSSSPLRNQNQV